MFRKPETSSANAHLRERASAGSGDHPTVGGKRLQKFQRAGEGNYAFHVFDFAAFDLAILRVVIGVGKQLANGGDAGPAMRLAHEFVGHEAVLRGPFCPHARDGGGGVDEHAVEVKEHATAPNFHEFHDTWYSAGQVMAGPFATQGKNEIESASDEIWRHVGGRCLVHRALTPRALDAISSLGERLCAPIFASALVELGVKSRAIAATELIVTDTFHGGAEPRMDLTRARCEAALRPLLNEACVPVVTGFIGATSEGVLTTLGRGGSDYSATILGAALGVDEVIIWTDVDGVLTADPRLVPDARTIPEISYREAAELAYFGAKVLHPKTLRAVMPAGIPVWIRNSFAPARPGTRISQQGRSIGGGVKALTAIRDVALISVGGPGIVGVPDVVGRTFSTTAELLPNVLLISQSSSQNDICFIVAAAHAHRPAEPLPPQFPSDLSHDVSDPLTTRPST